MLCWHHLEICNKFWTRGSALSFALGPANFVDSLAKRLCLLGAEGLSILLHLLITQPCPEQWDGRDLHYSLRHVGFLFALYSNFSITFFTTGQFSKVLNMPKLSRKSCTAEESTNIAFWNKPSYGWNEDSFLSFPPISRVICSRRIPSKAIKCVSILFSISRSSNNSCSWMGFPVEESSALRVTPDTLGSDVNVIGQSSLLSSWPPVVYSQHSSPSETFKRKSDSTTPFSKPSCEFSFHPVLEHVRHFLT